MNISQDRDLDPDILRKPAGFVGQSLLSGWALSARKQRLSFAAQMILSRSMAWAVLSRCTSSAISELRNRHEANSDLRSIAPLKKQPVD